MCLVNSLELLIKTNLSDSFSVVTRYLFIVGNHALLNPIIDRKKSVERKYMIDNKITNKWTKMVQSFRKNGNQVVQKTITKTVDAPAPIVEAKIEAPKIEMAVSITPLIEEKDPAQKHYEKVSAVKRENLKAYEKRVELVSHSQYSGQFKTAKSDTHYIQPKNGEGYYIGMSGGQCLIQRTIGNGKQGQSLPCILKRPNEGQGSGVNAIKTSYETQPDINKNAFQRKQGTDLSKSDYDSIVSGKPSLEVLLSVYDRYNQVAGKQMVLELNKAITSW